MYNFFVDFFLVNAISLLSQINGEICLDYDIPNVTKGGPIISDRFNDFSVTSQLNLYRVTLKHAQI